MVIGWILKRHRFGLRLINFCKEVDKIKKFIYNKGRIYLEGGLTMLIKSSTALRNEYDNLVKLAKEMVNLFILLEMVKAKWSFFP